MMSVCRITLQTLTDSEEKTGYSTKGLLALTGNEKFNPMLPFSRQEFTFSMPQKQKGMSISGYQPKLQLIIQDNQFTSIDQQGLYILKPSPADYPNLAENEHATMQLMKKLGFCVPENGLIAFNASELTAEKEFAFVIKRFDRTEEGKPIHKEQLDGAMNVREKYGKIGNDNEQYISYERAVKFILTHTENNLSQRQELFRRIVYAYLLGNNDLHLRNFSLIHSKEGKITLAPIYDFVSVAPYSDLFNSSILALPLLTKEEGGKELAHGFETIYGEYIGQDFIEFGENIGLSKRLIIEKLLPEIKAEAEMVEQVYQTSFLPEKHKEQILKAYLRRLNLLFILNEEKLLK